MKKILISLLFLPLVGAELSESNKRSFDEMASCELDDIDLNAQLPLNGPSFQELLGIYNEDTAGPAYVNEGAFDESDPSFWGRALPDLNIKPLEFGIVQTTKKLRKRDKKECCLECNKMVFNLINHMRIHTGERPYKCNWPDCDYASVQSSDLKKHIRMHTGEKPFKCNFPGCDFSCSVKSNLRVHVRMHTGEKPFKCNFEGCDFTCSAKSYLKAHEKKHTRPYNCTYLGCSYAAAQLIRLKHHERMHTEKPFKCEYCDHETTRLEVLQKHIKRYHENLGEL